MLGRKGTMKKERFVSLRVKISLGIILVCVLIGLVAILSVRKIATDIIDREYEDKAEQITEAVAHILDPNDVKEITDTVLAVYNSVDEIVPSSEWGSDAWNEYMSHYEGIEDLEVFQKIRDELRVYQDIFGVNCIYIMNEKPEITNAIYIVDGAYDDDACPPGVVDAYEDGYWPRGGDSIIPASITNEEQYGWLVSAGYPVILDGEVISHVCLDISMNDIKAKEQNYVFYATLAMIGLTILMVAGAILIMNKTLIKQIRMLSDTAQNYCSENNEVLHHSFEALQINSRDEIEQLLSSMKQMESDMNTNITALMDTKTVLKETEEETNTMRSLAVRDALTGVRNKTAYDAEVKKIEEEMTEGFTAFGLAMVDLNFLKRTNDTYGHEKGNVAIKKLCMLVCNVFKHSPVFRIGGDEFVVILRNNDYDQVDALVEEFNAHLATYQNDNSLEPWEQISAAIGIARFDQNTDTNVEDVFKRADQAMYDRKVAMKAERKD